MLHQRVCVVLISLYTICFSQEWIKLFGLQSASNNITRMHCDDSGNVWLAGGVYDSLKVFDTVLTSKGRDDCFVVKTDTLGTPKWIQTFGSAHVDRIGDMILKENGNRVVTGVFQEAMELGTKTLVAPVYESFFIAEFDTGSTPVWATTAFANAGAALAGDNRGNVVVVGTQGDTALIVPGDTLSGHGREDIFVAMYDNGGVARWATNIGGHYGDFGQAATFFNNEKICIGGDFVDTLFIAGDTVIPPSLNEQSFVAQFDTSGKLLWTRPLLSDGTVFLRAMVTDKSGNLYITGKFSGVLRLDTAELPCDNEYAFFLAKLTPAGKLVWVQQAELAYGNDIILGTENDVIVGGDYQRHTKFGEFEVYARDIQNVFVGSFSFDGACRWVRTAGGCRASHGKKIALAYPHIFMSGTTDADLVNNTCTMRFGVLELTYEQADVGRTFLAVVNYTIDSTGVREAPFRRAPVTGCSAGRLRAFDILGRDMPPGMRSPLYGKSLHAGGVNNRFGASQVIITRIDGSSSRSVQVR